MMNVMVDFSSLSEVERDDLAARLLVQAEKSSLAVRLPERVRPYSVDEAVLELGVSDSTVRRLVEAGRLRVVAGVGRVLIVAESLHGLMQGKG
tara:strand:- start:605 stop:883 length:279 start_codon:yes stop_codon:yes gene_type:complete